MPPNEASSVEIHSSVPEDHRQQQPFANVNEDYEMTSEHSHNIRIEKSKIKRCMQLIALILTIYFFYKLGKFVASGQDGYCRTALCRRAEQHLMNSINFSVDPCENFYEFACGNWKRRHQIYDKNSGTNAFRILYLQLKTDIARYVNQSNAKDEPVALHQARTMYQQCLNQGTNNDTTLFEEIAEVLQTVNLPIVPSYTARSANFTWFSTAALSKKFLDLTFFIDFEIQIDPNDNSAKKLAIGRPSRLLPFTNQPVAEPETETFNFQEILTADQSRYRYLKNLNKIAYAKGNFPWVDDNDYLFANTYELFLKFSSKYAWVRKQNFPNKNPNAPYITIAELQEITDQIFHYNEERTIYWKRYFEILFEGSDIKLDFHHTERVILIQDLAYIVEMLNLLAITPIHIIEYYMWIEVANGVIPFSSSTLIKPYSNLYRIMTGKSRKSRKSFCLHAVHEIYQSSIAYFLVRDHSIRKKFQKISEMFENIRSAYIEEVEAAEWLDSDTKKKIMEKLERMQKHIGYPNWMNDVKQYKTYELDDKSFLRTISKLKYERFMEHLSSYRRPVSEQEWWNDFVLNVNTFYSREFGSIVIPAAILNFPFYQLGLKALEYGAIGMIIGHEITHAFDTTELRHENTRTAEYSWSLDALKTYERRSNCFIDTYQEYILQNTAKRVDGLLTLDENIADNEGLQVAYKAYKKYIKKNGDEKLLPKLQFTADQLFFLSFANTWCERGTSESEAEALNNAHSPRPVRILASLRNSKAFSDAWQCKKGSLMNPNKEKCKLW